MIFRFSDFQVFEIDEKGNVVHLTSLENNLVESKPEVEVITEPLHQDVNIDGTDIPVAPASNIHFLQPNNNFIFL